MLAAFFPDRHECSGPLFNRFLVFRSLACRRSVADWKRIRTEAIMPFDGSEFETALVRLFDAMLGSASLPRGLLQSSIEHTGSRWGIRIQLTSLALRQVRARIGVEALGGCHGTGSQPPEMDRHERRLPDQSDIASFCDEWRNRLISGIGNFAQN
jgi:hypothetical protein